MSSVPSLLMTVGEQFYKLHEFIDEAEVAGVSKRIPIKSIPEGLQKGISKIFCAHPRAIVKVTAEGKTLQDLAYSLLEEGFIPEEQWTELVELEAPFWTGEELNAYDPVPAAMLDITYALSKLEGRKLAELEKELGLAYCMGIFGYSPFGGFQFVLGEDENDIPEGFEDVRTLASLGYVDPVRVKYFTDDGEAVFGDDEEE